MATPGKPFKRLWLIVVFVLPTFSQANEIRVAVASNFTATMRTLAELFERDTRHTVVLIVGSTGKHYAQISNGAPYDLLFAADVERPQLLEKNGLAVADSRFTYAIGQLVLWSPAADYIDARGDVLMNENFRYLAIANPILAPYGRAAKQVLISKGMWQQLSRKLVRGENIVQTFQFVQTGNAELGFVAYSQVLANTSSSSWLVPQELYTPLEQQAVILNDNAATREFKSFIQSDRAKQIIAVDGYRLPK